MIRRMSLMAWRSFLFCVSVSLWFPLYAEDPCKSGLPAGKKPGPYSAVVVTGPERGQSYCYICETGYNPGVIVFARSLTAPLGKLVGGLDKALTDHKKADLR